MVHWFQVPRLFSSLHSFLSPYLPSALSLYFLIFFLLLSLFAYVLLISLMCCILDTLVLSGAALLFLWVKISVISGNLLYFFLIPASYDLPPPCYSDFSWLQSNGNSNLCAFLCKRHICSMHVTPHHTGQSTFFFTSTINKDG